MSLCGECLRRALSARGWSRKPMLNRTKNRRKYQAERKRWRLPAVNWRRWGVLTAIVLALGVCLGSVRWMLDQPIETVVVVGRFQHVLPTDIERAVKAQTRGASVLNIDLARIRRTVESIQWVDKATIRRSWPRGVEVAIIEQIAAARWRESGLLNTRGELFVSAARFVPPELPQLSGPEGSEAAVAHRYLAIQGRLIEAGTRLVALRLDARGAWEVDLDNGITVRLGRSQIDERFETFMTSALKFVGPRAGDVAYVDMRYANGFAIGWRNDAARPKDKEGAASN